MRRLRENGDLEPEMSKTGEVVVEGRTIGASTVSSSYLTRRKAARKPKRCKMREKAWPARSPARHAAC